MIEVFTLELASRKFAYGSCDCLLVLGDWVERVTGVDPVPELRGSYSDEEGYKRILTERGGAVEFLDHLGRKISWGRTLNPIIGDVGLIELKDHLLVGAIRSDGMWVIKLNDSVQLLRVDQFHAAWSPTCPAL